MKHQILKVKQGDVIYSEGDDNRTMYLIKQGRVQLYNDVNEQVIDGMTVFHGSVVGELSFFDGLPRESCAKAIMNCVLIAIRFEDMQAQLGAIPPWFTTIIKSIVGRVRKTEENVVKAACKTSSMDYSKKDLKAEGYTYMDKNDLLKISTILSMVCAKYSKKGVSSLDVNFEALKIFTVRFQLGTSKMDAVLQILEEHEILKKEDLGEGKTKLEIFDIDTFDALIKRLISQADIPSLNQDAVRALNALDAYLKDEPTDGEGKKTGNIVKVQHNVLSQEKYFLRQAAFKLLEKAGFIEKEDDKSIDFTFDPKEIEAYLPTQKILSSLDNINKEH